MTTHETEGTCRICGCTDERACTPPCSWANKSHTLCSACLAKGVRWPKPFTLAATWDLYRSTIIPPDAPTVQVMETRRAFYAGAEAVVRGVLTALDPDEDPTEADLKTMARIDEELVEFGKLIERGVA